VLLKIILIVIGKSNRSWCRKKWIPAWS